MDTRFKQPKDLTPILMLAIVAAVWIFSTRGKR